MKMKRKNFEFEDFFWLPIFGFTTIGFDILGRPKPFYVKRLLNCITAFSLFSHFFCYYFLIQNFPALDLRRNTLPIMIAAGYVAFAINGNVKAFFLLSNRKRVCKIYEFLKSIYPGNNIERNIYRVDKYYVRKKEEFVTLSFFVSTWLLLFTPVAKSMVQFIYDCYTLGYEASHFQYLKFYETEYSINHRSPLAYTLIYLFETVNSHYLILTNLGTDLWLIPFAIHLRMHLDQTVQQILELKFSDNNHTNNRKELRKIIHKHELLMKVHSDLNGTFETSMAFNIVTTVGTLCTVGFRVSVIGPTKDFLFVWYLVSAVMRFYILCYHGQKLAEASGNVAYAVYNCQWYNASKECKKMLIILMIRASQPAELTVVGGPPISLDTFKIVMTVSYRIFAIFNSMME